MKLIAIIPARGESKRIPHKNIKPFLGTPILLYSIEAAMQSGIFDEIMVSTENKEIAELAIKAGVSVPFMRSHQTADDFTPLAEVIREVLMKYQERGNLFDYFCCLLPTAPFITSERLIHAFEILIKKKYNAVITVQPFSYPIQRALKIKNEKLHMIHPENYNKRSQDLSTTYHDSGQFYWIKTDVFLKEKILYSTNTGAIILHETEAHDIDSEIDWQIAEIKYRLIHKMNK